MTSMVMPAPPAEALRAPLRSYDLYVAGQDITGDGWVYTVSSRSLLEDAFASMALKRTLERNPDSAAAQHPYVVGRCAMAGESHRAAALDAAARAVPLWSATPLATRMRIGPMFRQALTEHEEEFLALMVAEGHPIRLARWELSCLLQVYSDESCAWYQQEMHTEFQHGGRRLLVRRQADGVVGLNPPQNAPAPSAALAGLILMAGNAVVVRAPRSIALSTMYVLRNLLVPILEELGAPAGTLNIICSNPKPTLDQWIASPLVDDVFYIGGVEEGLSLEAQCVAGGKKPVLELAGNDGVMVWKDADLDLAAEAICESFYGSGQICMVPNYVLVHPDAAEDLLALVEQKAAAVRPGYPDDEAVLLSPVRRGERFFRLLRDATDKGATLVCGGQRTDLDGTPSATGVFLQPTVLRWDGLAGARNLDVIREETFFPLLPVIVLDPGSDDQLLDDAIDFLNANAYGLRNSLWAQAEHVVDRVVGGVRNGGLLKVNDSHIGFLPYLPSHGGTGLTGGAFGEANYPILKTSHLQGVSIATGVSPREAVFPCRPAPKSADRLARSIEEVPCDV